MCTSLAKTGKCAREGCKWSHENAEWWEGAWWSVDAEGRSWGWWQAFPMSEECPVSLTPICLLPDPPFELRASGSQDSVQGPRHRFDAAALAKYLVGSGQFMDPVNRRPLKLEECMALDRATGGTFKVAEGFAAVHEAGGIERSRASREVAVAARQLFVLPNAASSGGAAGGIPQQQASQTNCSAQPLPQQPPVGPQEALVLHSEGGLQVIDDSVGELEAVEARGEQRFAAAGLGRAPTPAEALAKATAAKAQRPKFAPRARPTAQGGTSSGSKAAARGMGESTKPRPIIIEEPDKPRNLIIMEEPSSASAACGSAEAWAPPWATPQLQAVLLEELTRLSGRGELMLVDGSTVLEALRASQASNELLRQEAPMLIEVAVSSDVVVRLAVPLYYPMQPLMVVEARRAKDTKVAPAVLRGLEREVRLELSRLGEANEPLPLTALLRWMKGASGRLEALAQQADAERQAAHAAAVAADEAARSVAEAPAAADEKVVRLSEKYSQSWDLCTAFMKHGKCKNKNCKWRHERPVFSTPAVAPAAEASVPKSGAQKSGKSKK